MNVSLINLFRKIRRITFIIYDSIKWCFEDLHDVFKNILMVHYIANTVLVTLGVKVFISVAIVTCCGRGNVPKHKTQISKFETHVSRSQQIYLVVN